MFPSLPVPTAFVIEPSSTCFWGGFGGCSEYQPDCPYSYHSHRQLCRLSFSGSSAGKRLNGNRRVTWCNHCFGRNCYSCMFVVAGAIDRRGACLRRIFRSWCLINGQSGRGRRCRSWRDFVVWGKFNARTAGTGDGILALRKRGRALIERTSKVERIEEHRVAYTFGQHSLFTFKQNWPGGQASRFKHLVSAFFLTECSVCELKRAGKRTLGFATRPTRRLA